jgi:hypothetical protein
MMAKPPVNKPRQVPPDGYESEPLTPDSLADMTDWAPLDERVKVSETRVIVELTLVGVSTAAVTFVRKTALAARKIGRPQLPPKNWKDTLVGGVASLFTVISLGKMVAAYIAASAIGMSDPIVAGLGATVLGLMTIAGRRK